MSERGCGKREAFPEKKTGGAPSGAPPVLEKCCTLLFQFLQRSDHVVERGGRRRDGRVRILRLFRQRHQLVHRLDDDEEDGKGGDDKADADIEE